MDQQADSLLVKIDADATPLKNELQASARVGRQFASALTTAFEGVAFKGRSLSDVFRTLTLSLSRMTLTAAFRPLEKAVGGFVSSLLTGGGSLGFSKGAAIQGGLPVPFAKGGIVASPVTFPLAGGRTGLAGERGAEAIMPLTRGPDGSLGVAAHGATAVTISFNVTTPDAESFRRTEGQIAAMLARAVGRGQRNL